MSNFTSNITYEQLFYKIRVDYSFDKVLFLDERCLIFELDPNQQQKV